MNDYPIKLRVIYDWLMPYLMTDWALVIFGVVLFTWFAWRFTRRYY